MEEKALQQILEAEKKADEIIAAGVREAEAASEKAAVEMKEIRAKFDESVEKEVAKIIDAKKKEASKKAEQIEASILEECEKIEKQAESNMDKAVEFIIKSIGEGKWQ